MGDRFANSGEKNKVVCARDRPRWMPSEKTAIKKCQAVFQKPKTRIYIREQSSRFLSFHRVVAAEYAEGSSRVCAAFKSLMPEVETVDHTKYHF
jgi:hypothetical protein